MRTLVAALRAADPRQCEEKVSAILDVGFDGVIVEEPLHLPTWEALRRCVPRDRTLAIRLFTPYPRALRVGRRPDVVLGNPGGDERRQALRRGLATLEAAEGLGIPRVLVPTVDLDLSGAPRGFMPVTSPPDDDPQTRGARDAEVSVRMSAYLSTLSRLLDHADRYAVRLCLTPSSRPTEMPSFPETRAVLEELAGAPLGVWLDTARWPAEQLDVPTIGVRGDDGGRGDDDRGDDADGVSIHDARGMHEHLEPGTGDIDWPLLASSTRRHEIGCIDVEAARAAGDFARGLEFLRDLGRDAPPEHGVDGGLGPVS